jgi:hypothetical protein
LIINSPVLPTPGVSSGFGPSGSVTNPFFQRTDAAAAILGRDRMPPVIGRMVTVWNIGIKLIYGTAVPVLSANIWCVSDKGRGARLFASRQRGERANETRVLRILSQRCLPQSCE